MGKPFLGVPLRPPPPGIHPAAPPPPYFAQQAARSYQVSGARTPTTTGRIASVTTAGWSCWMKCWLCLAMLSRALGTRVARSCWLASARCSNASPGQSGISRICRAAVGQDGPRQRTKRGVHPRLTPLGEARVEVLALELRVPDPFECDELVALLERRPLRGCQQRLDLRVKRLVRRVDADETDDHVRIGTMEGFVEKMRGHSRARSLQSCVVPDPSHPGRPTLWLRPRPVDSERSPPADHQPASL